MVYECCREDLKAEEQDLLAYLELAISKSGLVKGRFGGCDRFD